MKKTLLLLAIAGILIISSCGSGNKSDKDKKDTIAKTDSTTKGTTEISSWDLYKKYTLDFAKASDEKNTGKQFKVSNLLVQFIQEGDNGAKEIDCCGYNPQTDSLTEGKETKKTTHKLNGKELKSMEYSYSFKFKLADPKEAEGLKKIDNNDMPNETIYTYFNVVTIEGTMSEVGSNFLTFDKCKITDKK